MPKSFDPHPRGCKSVLARACWPCGNGSGLGPAWVLDGSIPGQIWTKSPTAWHPSLIHLYVLLGSSFKMTPPHWLIKAFICNPNLQNACSHVVLNITNFCWINCNFSPSPQGCPPSVLYLDYLIMALTLINQKVQNHRPPQTRESWSAPSSWLAKKITRNKSSSNLSQQASV